MTAPSPAQIEEAAQMLVAHDADGVQTREDRRRSAIVARAYLASARLRAPTEAVEAARRIVEWVEHGQLVDDESLVQSLAPVVATALLSLSGDGDNSSPAMTPGF